LTIVWFTLLVIAKYDFLIKQMRVWSFRMSIH
jgi:hypothetical protein